MFFQLILLDKNQVMLRKKYYLNNRPTVPFFHFIRK